MVLIDDDDYFVVLIDNAGKSYILNSVFFDEYSFKRLRELFKLNINLASFDDGSYNEGRSIIIYPHQYYGKPLFKKNRTLLQTVISFLKKLFAIRNPAWGYLSEESKSVITSNRLD